MARTALELKQLFDPEFLESLSRLRIVSRRVARGGRHAEQRSRDLGTGIEFRDFRPYSPGDDFRAIDWNIYRRLGKVFLRLFEELEDLPVYILPDISDSMFLEESPRIVAGLRSALAMASIALNQHDSAGLFPFGEDLESAVRPMAGRGRLMQLAKTMAAWEPKGQTDFARSMRRFDSLGLRRGLCVIISDFFDPAGIEAVLGSLKRLRHQVLLIQLTRSTDRDPGVEGDLQLVDCETGVAEDVSATSAVLEQYRAAYDRFQGALARFAKQRDMGLVKLDTDKEIVPQLATLFETGSYVA